MICPRCDESEVTVIHEDTIECGDCGGLINIQYCLCPKCNYGFRLNNGKFLDEMDITEDALHDVVEDIEEILSEDNDPVEMAWSGPYLKSMGSLINPCVRCGGSLTIYDDKLKEYECLSCGFKWEILTSV